MCAARRIPPARTGRGSGFPGRQECALPFSWSSPRSPSCSPPDAPAPGSIRLRTSGVTAESPAGRRPGPPGLLPLPAGRRRPLPEGGSDRARAAGCRPGRRRRLPARDAGARARARPGHGPGEGRRTGRRAAAAVRLRDGPGASRTCCPGSSPASRGSSRTPCWTLRDHQPGVGRRGARRSPRARRRPAERVPADVARLHATTTSCATRRLDRWRPAGDADSRRCSAIARRRAGRSSATCRSSPC